MVTRSRKGKKTALIGLIAQHDSAHPSYQTKDRDGEPAEVNEFVPFELAKCGPISPPGTQP
jgi:hypothetical protein